MYTQFVHAVGVNVMLTVLTSSTLKSTSHLESNILITHQPHLIVINKKITYPNHLKEEEEEERTNKTSRSVVGICVGDGFLETC